MADNQDFMNELRAFIVEGVREEAEPGREINDHTVLLGQDAVLSSLGLVGLLVRVEDFCLSAGRSFNWTQDAAMSPKNSPFRTIGTLAAYVSENAKNEAGA